MINYKVVINNNKLYDTITIEVFMKNFKKNTVILLIISTLLVFFLVKDNFIETVRLIRGANMGWILFSFLLYYAYVYLEAVLMYLIVVKYQKNYKFSKTLKLITMTKFFNGITPFATGGQPIQVYELKKDGISTSKGTTIIVESFLIFQFTIILLGIIGIVIKSIFHFFTLTPVMFYMTIVGFILNIIMFITVFTISINKRMNIGINKFVIKLINKLKIKDKLKRKRKINKYFKEYYDAFQSLKSNKKLILTGILLEVVALLALFATPLFIFKALNIEYTINLLGTVIISIYVFIIGSYIPIPGGTGSTEYAFLELFKGKIPQISLTPALIIWRFVTYYAPVLIGGIVFNLFKKQSRDVI